MRFSFSLSLIAICFLLISGQEGAFAQEKVSNQELTLTLESVIRQAQDSSITASLSRELAAKDYWGYSRYLSEKGPQVTFNMNPSYVKQNHNVEYSYLYPTSYNMLSSDASISYSQQITDLGGYLYADTRFIWSEYFGAMKNEYNVPRAFGVTPARVGYRQELLGWNGLSWQKRIEESSYRTSRRKLTYRLLQIAEEASNLFFDYMACEERYKIYEQNFRSAENLLKIGKKKLSLTTITVAELRSLELERNNTYTQLEQAKALLDNARRELLSYLRMKDEGQMILVKMPDIPNALSIRIPDAVDMAVKNNPEILELDDESLRAEYELDYARHQKGLQAALNINIGLHNYGTDFAKLYSRPELNALAQITLSFPIFDSGLAKHREQEAHSAYNSTLLAAQEERRRLEQAVTSLANLLESQQLTLSNAAESVGLADETFELIGKMYAEGMVDINTYQLALNRKDSAHQLFTATLCSFWSNYFKLSRLTMYDYINGSAL